MPRDEEGAPRRKRRESSPDDFDVRRFRPGPDEDDRGEEDDSRPRRKRRPEEDEDEPRPRRKRGKKREEVTSRVYVHGACGGATEVSGDDFTMLTDPFGFVSGTYCCGCQSFVGLGEVRWADTDERISDYRARLRREAPVGLKLFRWVGGPAGGGLIGLLCAVPFAKDGAGPLIAGLLAGGMVLGYFIAAPLAGLIWKTDYRAEP